MKIVFTGDLMETFKTVGDIYDEDVTIGIFKIVRGIYDEDVTIGIFKICGNHRGHTP